MPFTKNSIEAKEFMAKLRQMKKLNKPEVIKNEKPSVNVTLTTEEMKSILPPKITKIISQEHSTEENTPFELPTDKFMLLLNIVLELQSDIDYLMKQV